jgi:hypothetical protein
MKEVPFNTARRIRRGERDHELTLGLPKWPHDARVPNGWEPRTGHLIRLIGCDGNSLLGEPLEEAMLRFPAAPLHGVQRLHEGHNSAADGKAQNFHTYRILTSQGFKGPVDRVFLFHNGLNELDRLSWPYQLASHLLTDPRFKTACILRPLPGHLTRFPYYAFADTPLDRYLWDGSSLFRQFLRYMVETQWFLSAFVRRSRYRTSSGTLLLEEGEDTEPNRLDPAVLADAIGNAWKDLYRASAIELEKAMETQSKAPGMDKMLRGSRRVYEDIEALRNYLGLNWKPELGSCLTDEPEPSIHVVGYSLGGFVAQSVFMSWPYAIDSCSTVLSGGALRDLAPTAFADPEEWQTVLHSLRYELDEAMINGRLGSEPGKLAGMDSELFLYFQRTFYEVFQQEYRGSFQSRLAEFRQRMLFVVGGNDPIVRTKNVLDSEPPGGINLLEVAGLGHFIGGKPESPEETKQRQYWLPEMGGLISRFAAETSRAHRETRKDTWLDADLKVVIRSPRSNVGGRGELLLTDTERDAFQQDGALPTKLFERYLDDLLARTTRRSGYLWILRNEIPTFMLDEFSIQHRARSLHHDDVGVVEYCRGVKSRAEALVESRPRTTVVIPWNARRIIERVDAKHGHPSQAETAPGRMPVYTKLEDMWTKCLEKCHELVANGNDRTVMVFDGRQPLAASREGDGEPTTEAHRARVAILNAGLQAVRDTAVEARGDGKVRVPSLPDCWIWTSHRFLKANRTTPVEEITPKFLTAVAKTLSTNTKLADSIRKDEVRMVTVSRARYNPRFRGRIVTDFVSAKTVLLHASLCISASLPIQKFDWTSAEEGKGGEARSMRSRSSDAPV